jgi:hypothetical protein
VQQRQKKVKKGKRQARGRKELEGMVETKVPEKGSQVCRRTPEKKDRGVSGTQGHTAR